MKPAAAPDDTLGNPQEYAAVEMHKAPDEQPAAANPIANANPPKPAAPASSKPQDLDKILKDVNRDVKASIKSPTKISKPVLIISLAVVVAICLSAAAFFAFKRSS